LEQYPNNNNRAGFHFSTARPCIANSGSSRVSPLSNFAFVCSYVFDSNKISKEKNVINMGKILTLLLIVMFLTLPSLIISRQVSVTFAANNNLAPNVTLLWNYTTSNGVWFSPTIYNGVLYVGCEDPFFIGTQGSHSGNLYALNAANGDKLWNYSIPVCSSPTVDGGVVYVGSFDGNVYAFNAANGVKLWSYFVRDYVASPAIADGIIYVGLSDGNLALNITNGKEIWKHQTTGGEVGSPVVNDGTVFAASSTFIPIKYVGGVYALNASNGKMLWDYSYTFNNFYPPTVVGPTVVGETLYVGIGSNVSALSFVDGSQIWSSNVSKQVGLTPVVLRPTAVLDSTLFVSSSDGNVYALNANSGEKIWNQSLGNQIETSPVAASGTVYIGSDDDNLYALNAANGGILWNYTISDRDHAVQSSPVVANGVVYIGSGAHNVYAFGYPANPNASPNTFPIAIGAALIIIIIIIIIILVLKRLKPKPPTS
jgi:eukaryotic-like serine/threonine-protein kinase